MRKLLSAAALMLALFALAGCSLGIPDAPASPKPSLSASPTGSDASLPPQPPSPAPVPTLPQPTDSVETNQPSSMPTSCDELGSAQTRSNTVDQVIFYPEVELPPIIENYDPILSCYWFAGDVSGATIVIAAVQEHDAVTMMENATLDGFACTPQNGYTNCQLHVDLDYTGNPYEVTHFYLYGAGVWLEAIGSNMNIAPLIDEIAVSLWQ